MIGSRHAIALGIGLFALAFAGAAQAQDLSAGKTPAQLFQLNCSTCHKSARGLAAAGASRGGFSGLEGFLAEHYTSSGRSAEIIAAYLKSVGGAAQAARGTKHHRKAAKPRDKTEATKKVEKSDRPDKMKTGKAKPGAAAKTTDKTTDKTSDKPKMSGSKTGTKKPVLQSSQAKREKPVPAKKKTD